MTDIQNVLVVGLGAIGTIYAAKLADYDPRCVRVLVDEGRRARYHADGIVLNGVRRDFSYVLPSPDAAPADLILIATKADGLPDAIEAIAPFVRDHTLVLPLLNGITSEDAVAERYGWDRVLHAYFVGHGSMRVGNAVTFDGVGRIVLGEANAAGRTARVERVAQFFDHAGIGYEVPDDILLAQWSKFVLNVGINQASAVLRADYGAFQRSEQAYALALDLMREALAVAERIGIRNTETILPWCDRFIQTTPPAFKSSMLQDIEAGKNTEVDLFGGAVCALGEQHGIATPLNALFVRLIKALEPV